MRASKIFCIIAYDIADNKTRAKVMKLLRKYGTSVNLSVFECMTTETQLRNLVGKINKIVNSQSDKVIYYRICMNCYSKIIYHPEKIMRRKEISNLV